MSERQAEILRAENLLQECMEMLRKEGIPVSEHILGIVINPRIRSRFGSCRRVEERNKRGRVIKTAGYRIELSRHMMDCGDEDIKTILFHELLHTCPRCMNHGRTWKTYADHLNKKYGLNIKTTARYSDFGMEEPAGREEVKYRIVCQSCGQELARKRRCSLVENTDRYRCGKCGGMLKIL